MAVVWERLTCIENLVLNERTRCFAGKEYKARHFQNLQSTEIFTGSGVIGVDDENKKKYFTTEILG